MIHAASRQALAQLRERLNAVLDALPRSADGANHKALAAELYSAAELLVSEPRLRRTLGDPSTDASARGELAKSLLRGKLSDEALDLVGTAVAQRWSSPWDLVDALEISADDTLLSAAEQQGKLDDVDDELFRFERILADGGELSAAFDEAGVEPARRIALLNSLLSGKVNPITLELLTHAVSSTRKRSLQLAIDDLIEASAARRARSVARVLTASELTSEQEARLGRALTDIYGRQISVRTAIDPNVKGGLVVRVGDEVIDGSVAARLAAARAALAG
jgi:F-type H+-transporting ATPase subunit delta